MIGLLFSIGFGCAQMNNLNEEPITVTATYMQYACGEWNDDMKVASVSDSAYLFLVEKDIDPLVFNGDSVLNDLFYKYKTNEFYMTYKLTGFISKNALSGCEDRAPKFWVQNIRLMNDQLIFNIPK